MKKKLNLSELSVKSNVTELKQRNLTVGGAWSSNDWDESWAMTNCGGPEYCNGNNTVPFVGC